MDKYAYKVRVTKEAIPLMFKEGQYHIKKGISQDCKLIECHMNKYDDTVDFYFADVLDCTDVDMEIEKIGE